MKVVKPVKVNDDAILTASTIAEPDLLAGEVEWKSIDDYVIGDSYADRYQDSVISRANGYAYAVGFNGSIDKIDMQTGAIVLSIGGGLLGNYNGIDEAGDFKLYAGGSDGILKVDPVDDSYTLITNPNVSYSNAVSGGNGNMYFQTWSGEDAFPVNVYDISTGVFTEILFSQYSNESTTDLNGDVYFSGLYGAVARLAVREQAIYGLGSLGSSDIFASCKGVDGNPYFGTDDGRVLTTVAGEDKLTLHASVGEEINAMVDTQDGLIVDCEINTYLISSDGGVISTIGKIQGSVQSISKNSSGRSLALGFASDVVLIREPYAEDDQVVKLSTHKIYQAVTATYDDPEVGVDLTIPSWVQVSATNKYKAFDDVVTTSTESSDGLIVMTIKPGQLFDSIAGLNCQGVNDVNIVMTDPTEGEVYNKDISMQNNGDVIDWYSYLWTDIEQSTTFAVFDMPPYSNATVTVTLTGGSNLSVGVITTGKAFDLGVTQYKTGVQLLDFSRIEEDAFGNLDIEKRVPSNLVDFVVTVESKSKLDYVYSQLKSLVGEVALYIGEEELPKEMTSAYGLHRNIKLNKNTPTSNTYTLQVRGLV